MKLISCFSYKGGAGRSTLAINVIPFLAKELNASVKTPLILVDMDIDSCGLTYLLKLDSQGLIDDNCNVQRLFGDGGAIPRDGNTVVDHDLFRYMCPVGEVFGYENEAILCLPAKPGAVLGTTNYDGSNQNCSEFVDECEDCDCCGILFDSAVGDQLTAQWSNELSDYILCCMRPTQQFRRGTKTFFDQFDERTRRKKIIVIPNVVPTEALELVTDGTPCKYPEYAQNQIIENFATNISRKNNEYNMELVTGETFGIPKIDRFMWQEDILYNLALDELTPHEKLAKVQYGKIASIIARPNFNEDK